MRLSLGQTLSLRMEQRLPQSIICNLPIFELSLAGIKGLNDYIEREMSSEEIESLGVKSHGGSRKKAFFDQSIEDLIEEAQVRELRDPDIKASYVEGELRFDYSLPSLDTQEYVPGNGECNLFRNPKTLLKELRWIDRSIRKACDIVLNYQREYIQTDDVSKLKPLGLRDVSKQMGIHFTTVSRLLKNKTFRTCDGYIMPVDSLLVTGDVINRLKVCKIFGKMLERGDYSNDDKLVMNLYERTGGEDGGILLARRTITKYRNNLEEAMKRNPYLFLAYILRAAYKGL